MLKKSLAVLTLVLTLFVGGCSVSFDKSSLISKTRLLEDEATRLQDKVEEYRKADDIIDFYNTLTTETMDSLVVIRSNYQYGGNYKYSNGIVIASSGFTMYVLADYYAVDQYLGRYTLIDSYANEYSAQLYTYDEETGLGLFRCTWDYYADNISIGQETSLVAQIDSVSWINNATILENIKSSTMQYDNATYKCYHLDDMDMNAGTIFINEDNELMGIYSSKMDIIISEIVLNLMINF